MQDLPRRPVEFGSRGSRLLVLGALLVAALVMVLPAMRGEFTNQDDPELLLGENGALARSVPSLFTGRYFHAYLPFYGLSYKLDALAFGARPAGFRAGNALWHAAAAYALFLLLTLLAGDRRAAFGGALLFLLHPAHVESVSWIAGRKEPLSAFFLFVAWLFHLRGEEGRRGAGALAVLFFLVACFSKPSAIVLPGLLLAAAWLLPRYEGARREAALRCVPLCCAALLPAAVAIAVGVAEGVVAPGGPLAARLLTGAAAFGGSLLAAVVPLGLAVDYPGARDPSWAAAAVPLAALAAALAALFLTRRRAPWVAFGLLAFLVALAPFNGVFPATTIARADRYLYLPLLLVSATAVWAVRRLFYGPLAAGVLAVGYALLSVLSSGRFSSNEELWTRTIAAQDRSAVAWLNRGTDRFHRARAAVPPHPELLARAAADFEAGLARARFDEHRIKARAGLQECAILQGDWVLSFTHADGALALLESRTAADAVRMRAAILYHRGLAWSAVARPQDALRDFAEAAALWRRENHLFELGRAALRLGRLPQAKEALDGARALDPGSIRACLLLAELYKNLQGRGAWERELEEAARRAPRSPAVAEAWVEFRLWGSSPDYIAARRELERLPEGSAARAHLASWVEAERALYLSRRGEREESLAAADAALAGGVEKPETVYGLGNIYLEAGRFDDAIRCYRAASDVLRDRPAYRDAVARAYTLKAYALLTAEAPALAAAAMGSALEAGPEQIEAGAAPLQGEIAELREVRSEACLLLAAAAVAGDLKRAEEIAARRFEQDPEAEERTLLLRLRALARGFGGLQLRGAEDDLNEILGRQPEDRWARFRLGQVLAREGGAWLRTGEQIDNPERVTQGRALLGRAIALFSAIVEGDGSFLMARLARGAAHFARGSPEDLLQAHADFDHVAKKDPGNKEVLFNQAALFRLTYVRGGDERNLETAIERLQQALLLDPNYFDALYELGNVYHLLFDRSDAARTDRSQAYGLAIKWYRRAIAINPRSPDPRREFAALCLKVAQEARTMGKLKEAEAILARAEEQASTLPGVRKERLRLLLTPEFGRETGRKPDELFAAGEAQLAALEQSAPDDPELPALHAQFQRFRGFNYYLAFLTIKEETRKERARQLAAEAWKKALEAWPDDPENESVRERLREIAPEEILPDRQRAEQRYREGLAAFEERRWIDAQIAFREALQLFPEVQEIRFSLGMALLHGGNLEEARTQFERVANQEGVREGELAARASLELGHLSRVKKDPVVALVWYRRYLETMERLGRGGEPAVDEVRRLIEEVR
ncbi:MAG: tetratricopeptide repeat protein [Planctomycetaceae bacterium]